MELSSLSSRYTVRPLLEDDVPQILRLFKGNPLYFEHCPPPPSEDGIRAEMAALPPGKTARDKHYLGFFDGGSLAAVLDLIDGWPDGKTAYIGFFMLDAARQGRGEGSRLVSSCCGALKAAGVCRVRLGFAKGNPQSEAFWRRNGFAQAGAERPADGYVVVPMEKLL